MSGITPIISRTSTLLNSQTALARLQETQTELYDAQEQITTGRAINRPSDAAAQVSSVMYLENRLAEREQQSQNLTTAAGYLNFADAGLGDANDLLIEARSIASSQIGVGSDTATREAEALVIDSSVQAMMEIANRQFNGLSVFGGNNGAAPGEAIFEDFLGGVRYAGSDDDLLADLGGFTDQAINANGVEAFGALSARVKSTQNYAPQATANTRLADVNGALGEGIRKGSINVVINATPVAVDLQTADTMGDVVTRINDAIATAAPGAGSVALTANGFAVTGNGGNTIAIADPLGGQTALDLGIEGLSSTGGVAAAGTDVGIRLTETTPLAALGGGIDFASGLVIEQGAETRTVDLSTATTVQELQNIIRGLNLGLRVEINDDGNALDLVTEVAGLTLSVGENGGTTAEDLGWRTLGAATELDVFRNGLGVETVAGENDASFTLHDGTAFDVNFDGATTVQDVIDQINAAALAAGATIGTGAGQFSATLATTGNGIVLTDNTAGAGAFTVSEANQSQALFHLGFGLENDLGAGTTLTSEDKAAARVENLFTHLIDLRDALTSDDTTGITLAGGSLEQDIEASIAARGQVGAQAKRVEDSQTRLDDQRLTEQGMLSELKDADLTEVITRYQQLQLQLQASLQTTAQIQQLSLLDFLR
ncbi:MAG: flagellin [Planctomycetota bacterium]